MSDTPSSSITDKVAEKLRAALNDERELTKKELGELDRAIRNAMDENHRGITATLESHGVTLKEVAEFIADEKKKREEADNVKTNKSTIVVPPNDVKPVQPEQPEAAISPTNEAPRRSWKDWF